LSSFEKLKRRWMGEIGGVFKVEIAAEISK